MVKRIIASATAILLITISCNDNQATHDQTNIPQAEKELKDQVAQHPDSLLLKESLIEYYKNNGNYSQAISETDNALNKDSSNARLWDIKGTLCFLNADTLNAIRSFEKAVDIFPEPQYIIALGTLYAQTKNPMALAMADGLLQAPKANAMVQALFIKGLYYNYTTDYSKAISFFDQCLQEDYNFMDAYREKGIALYDLGKYEDAIAFLDKAITVQTGFDEGYYWMGRCYEKINKKKEAIEHYRLALQIDPEYVEAKDALAKLGAQ